MTTAAVIGSGFGGLALAIRLQSAGIADHPDRGARQAGRPRLCLGARRLHLRRRADRHHRSRLPGGAVGAVRPRHGRRRRADAGHAVLPAQLARRHHLRLFQRRRPRSTRQIAGAEPDGRRRLPTLPRISRTASSAKAISKLGHVPFLDFRSMMKAAPRLLKLPGLALGLFDGVAASSRTRSCARRFSFHTLLVGGNPMTTSAIYALIHKLEKDGGVWFPRGGTKRAGRGMVTLFERLGGTVRLGRSGRRDRHAAATG